MDIERVAAWTIEQGLAGAPETDLLSGFCEQCRAAGLMLSRGLAVIDTLHPVFEGRVYRWRADASDETPILEYGRSSEGEAAQSWRRSVFYYLFNGERDEFRCRLGRDAAEDAGDLGEHPLVRFPLLKTMQEEGQTDYIALIQRFTSAGSIGEMDGRPARSAALPRRSSRRCGGSLRRWPSRSNAPLWPASRARWPRSISGAMQAGES
jgi:adenylate cyclase